MRSSSLAETRPPRRATRHWTGASLGWVLEPWGPQFLAQPSKVLSTVASRARVTPVEGERDKPTLVEARHLGGRNLTGRRGFSCQQAKVAPATQMEGKGGKLLARMSLAQGSLAASLVDNNNTVAVAASTVSPSTTTTTTGSTATSRTRDSTTRTRDSITRTRDSTTRTRTPGGASATTV